ncbi:MAG TPA: hypothetical protein VFH95_01035 [Candidatus Kapabacteria bacterium]|nr:hypothetical protein [Candidatus Kapabacteria bacterium]
MKAFIIAVVLLTLCAGSSLYAQTHTAQNDSMVAAGWTWVHSFDSLGPAGVSIKPYGDTVLYQGADTAILVSVDGGKTIDHRWMPISSDPIYGPSYGQFFDRDPVAVATSLPGDARVFNDLISTDLGRSYRTYLIDTANFNWPPPPNVPGAHSFKNFWMDPTDNGTFYLEYGITDGDYDFPQFNQSSIARSTDTGKTWTVLNLPSPSYGGGLNGTVRQAIMDVRQHGLTYFMVTDGDEGCVDWYKTDSLGNYVPCYPFQGMLSGGEQAGVGYPGELRRPWSPRNTSNARGFEAWKDDYRNPHTLYDWADSLVPGIPDSIDGFDGKYFGIWYYDFSANNPTPILVPISEDLIYNDNSEHGTYEIWWFYSSTGYGPFTKLAHEKNTLASKLPEPISLTLDRRNSYRIWAMMNDSIGDQVISYDSVAEWDSITKQYIVVWDSMMGPMVNSDVYYRDMPHSSSEVAREHIQSDNITAQLMTSEIEFGHLEPDADRAEIFDILGRRILAVPLWPYEQNRVTKFQTPLSPGAYVIAIFSRAGTIIKSLPEIVR